MIKGQLYDVPRFPGPFVATQVYNDFKRKLHLKFPWNFVLLKNETETRSVYCVQNIAYTFKYFFLFVCFYFIFYFITFISNNSKNINF